ncbi:BTB/POZ and MATH domain-containing protein 3-like [Lolium rigidum]|uniref:BTB/POZ and MATH domain-containing protein 3-like n=1 Tax=Lolium rigidum TaxID=89674 RepID=UPI001F5C18C9|nr:BTB/POZ and MATH domain-containing protein 3-like [Lolium rigidum]
MSASTIFAARARGYHLLTIDGYSCTKDLPTGKSLQSHQFTVGGHRWHINYYPNGEESESADYISIFLFLDEDANTEVKAQHSFRLVDKVEEQAPSLTSVVAKNFAGKSGWGTAKFIKREAFEKSKYLSADSFAIRCDIVVIDEFRTEMAKTSGTKFVTVPPSDLNQHLGDLLNTKKGADVVFEVGDEKFPAHRWLLAARSPVFSAELFGSMKEGDAAGGVHITDMQPQVFKALLRFVYTDSLPETKTEEDEEDVMCQHLLVAADRYNMERLKLICEEKLCEYIDVGSVATILALAEQHHCVGLKKACFDFLSCPANRSAVVATEGFQHVYRSCPSVVMELIAMPSRPLAQ